MLGPFWIGQVPAEPLIIEVRDPVTDEVVDLSAYTGCSFVLEAPDGDPVDLSAGTSEIEDATAGTCRHQFAGDSPFTMAGDHRLQVVLEASGVSDPTEPLTFEVYTPLGG